MTNSSINNDVSLEIENLSVADVQMCSPVNCSNFITQGNHTLNIIHTNIRSINKNFDQFNIILSITNISYDIIVMTECWIKDSKYIPVLQGYTSCHNNPLQNDGVVLYVKDNLAGKILEPDFYDANLVYTVNNIAIISIYRSPSHVDLSRFYYGLEKIYSSLKKYNSIVLIGDLNTDIKPTSIDRHYNEYLTFTAALGQHMFFQQEKQTVSIIYF